jgi:hypothetical protein
VLRSIWRALVLVLGLSALAQVPAHAMEVLLASGQTLEVEEHRLEGDAVILVFEGGNIVALLAEQVVSIDGEPLSAKAAVSAGEEWVEPLPEPPSAVAAAPVVPPPAAGGEPDALDRLIGELSDRYEVDPLLVQAVIQVESMWDPDAVSPKGAKGLMQLMPVTAKGHGVTDPFDPAQNIRAGVIELANNLRHHSGELSVALAAYNAGGVAVKRYNGIPPYRETIDYVDRVLDLYFSWAEGAPREEPAAPSATPSAGR